jgi:hypothetical protein
VADRAVLTSVAHPDLVGRLDLVLSAAAARDPDTGVVGHPTTVVVGATTMPGVRLLTLRNPATNRSSVARTGLRVGQLLVPPAVHHGDPIGHRHPPGRVT